MGLDQFMTKNLLAQAIPAKIFGTKQRYPVKLDRTKDV